MGLENAYNGLSGFKEKIKWVKPGLYELNIKRTNEGFTTQWAEDTAGHTFGFIS